MKALSKADAVDTDALLRTSQADREAAERLLHDLGLVAQWQAYGDVEPTGSYRWNLMLGSDIDLNVVNPACDLDLALDIVNHFVRQGPFLRFSFIDSVRGMPSWADLNSYPEGYFFGMAGDFDGREWKVETWLLRSPPSPQDWIQEHLSVEGRRTILHLKHLRNSGTWKASSFDIYRAVLLGGARDPSEAEQWLSLEKEQKP